MHTAATVLQIYSEVEERAAFVDALKGARGREDAIAGVQQEMAQRLKELHDLGEDVSAGRDPLRHLPWPRT